MNTDSELQRRLDRMQREQEIHCPHCDALFPDDECRHVSYWADREAQRQECPVCEKEYIVSEHVRRTYTTSPVS